MKCQQVGLFIYLLYFVNKSGIIIDSIKTIPAGPKSTHLGQTITLLHCNVFFLSTVNKSHENTKHNDALVSQYFMTFLPWGADVNIEMGSQMSTFIF